MTNEWIDWSDSRLRVPLRVNGFPYPQPYYLASGNGIHSARDSYLMASTCAAAIGGGVGGGNVASNLSCLTSQKFQRKARKLQQLKATNDRLKGN